MWNDDNEAALKTVLEDVRRYSSIPVGIQLGHAGRKASCAVPREGGKQIAPEAGGWQTVAPSALSYSADEVKPVAMNTDDLARVKQAFVDSALRAVRLGIQLIEVHAAHGYLLHQFLSPLSNQRSDEYGGSLENRMRFPLEVFKAVRDAVPASVPVGVRISATDWVEGGWEINQSIAFSRELEALNSAYIHVSSGGLSEDQKISVGPNYQVPFARDIREQVSIPVIAVGLITEPQQAEDLLQQGEADWWRWRAVFSTIRAGRGTQLLRWMVKSGSATVSAFRTARCKRHPDAGSVSFNGQTALTAVCPVSYKMPFSRRCCSSMMVLASTISPRSIACNAGRNRSQAPRYPHPLPLFRRHHRYAADRHTRQ